MNGPGAMRDMSWLLNNFADHLVCAQVTSLSPFVLFNPTTSTALGSSLNPSTYGQSVTFTAMVTASGGTPTLP